MINYKLRLKHSFYVQQINDKNSDHNKSRIKDFIDIEIIEMNF